MAAFRLLIVAILVCVTSTCAFAEAIKTELVQRPDGQWQLLREGKPYFIKGVGGDGAKPMLAELGGNSFRTWGADNLGAKLDEAQKLGLTVACGIWLEHERHGFSYDDPKFVAKQLERTRETILKHKDHPAVLLWGIGNEMEGYKAGDDPKIWKAVNDIAAMAKKLDPNHPTMTVIAELGGKRVQSIHQMCPDIDIVGINTYAGIVSIPKRYKDAGGTKPYIITEFGPPGTWEVPKNSFNALVEPTSTQKGESYRRGYEAAIASQPLCLGSYAFTWGNKQEATATWFGMLLPDNTRLAAVEEVAKLWTNKPPSNRCPIIEPLKLDGGDGSAPGKTFAATVVVTDPDGDPIKLNWELHRDAEKLGTGGDREDPTQQFPDAIKPIDDRRVEITLPEKPGIYRLYVYAHNGHGNGATANAPILARSDAPATQAATAKPVLVIFADGAPASGFVPSGWMGNTSAIKLDDKCTTAPHSGETCMKLQYTAPDNFGGVVWQFPANDWGEQPDSKDLSGAKRLTFWARGEAGGEKVEFKFGVLGAEKKFPDTASGETTVTLTKDWKQYAIDLSGKDLSRIKTGFCWVLAGQGRPITFFLDDVRYE